ncbi:heavy metal translocating P-type ATPase [Fluoribacter dumoffii]|uniref:P-type Zn(2+) transporter n=1 Tax=Fluoribacter dumoffii TaxID=463 RepID=A0A377GCI8_9GAMM|nr:cation transport ATPase [Fluoribacter dumoffii NY 23]STO22221.1 Copper-transporting P-type ATPase [Fluoribacter dumoffii]
MNLSSSTIASKWKVILVFLTLAAIILYFIMKIMNLPWSQIPLLLIVIIGGIPLFLQIIIKLIQGNLGADSLAAIALVTGTILQEYLAVAFIILMLAGGQVLEHYAMGKASSVLMALAARMPTKAHRKSKSQLEDITLDDIRIGDDIVIYPYEVCPVDGTVVEGHGVMDESYLTGEPYMISKAPGISVISGAINGDSPLTIKASKLPSDSRYAAIVGVLKEAEQKKPSLRRLGDQIGAVFAPVALLFACAAWFLTGDAMRFLAVIVIATPCPLLIAIPITLISAISMAAKQSIIIRDPTVLERLPTCETAIFDKTGTLTYGKPTLSAIHLAKNTHLTEENILQFTASLERYSKHPLAPAILNAAKERHLQLLDAIHVSEKPGHGLTGTIDHHRIHVTSRNKFLLHSPEFVSELPPESSGLECIIIHDEQFAGSLVFHDAPRKEGKSFISHLTPSHQFTKIMLVSGDRESEVKYLASQLNLKEIRASQSPEQKLAIVREERKKAPTLFMGDGINDAPALTAATVGIAFGQFSNITSEAAGAVILENTLKKVDELIHLSLNTRKIALQSAIGGMLLSFIGMSFASVGFITPVTGAILQELIDALAIINALRLSWGGTIKTDIPHVPVD